MGVQFAGNILVQANGGPLPISQGGTGQTTAPTAINALLPTQAGQSGKVLTTNGTNVSWSASAGGSPGGADTQIQYNDSGTFGGSANLVINKSTGAVTGASTFTNIGTNITGAAATIRPIKFQTASSDRWITQVNSTAESGSNVGSDYEFIRVADNGATQNQVFTVARSTGVVDFKVAPTVNGSPIGGSGTVTSVALSSANGAITVSGSPVTTSGTLNITANNFTTSVAGVVPASGGGTTNFLRADGSWAVPTASATAVRGTTNPGFSIAETSASVYAASGFPIFRLINASAAADNRMSWNRTDADGTLRWSLINDADSAATSWLTVARSANTATMITYTATGINLAIGATGLQINGSAGTSGQVLTSQGAAAPIWSSPTVTALGASGASTFSGSTTAVYAGVASATPNLNFVNTSAAVNSRASYERLTSGGTLEMGWLTDAGGSPTAWLSATRVSGANTTANITLTSDVINLADLSSGLQLNGAVGTSGQVLTSQGAAAPIWSTVSATSLTATASTPTPATAIATTGVYASTTGAQPTFWWNNASGAANTKLSVIDQTNGGLLSFKFANDAWNTSASWLTAQRGSGANTATAITFAGTAINLTGLTSGLQINSAAGTAGQVLTSAGNAAAPTWSSAATGITSVGTLSGLQVTGNPTVGLGATNLGWYTAGAAWRGIDVITANGDNSSLVSRGSNNSLNLVYNWYQNSGGAQQYTTSLSAASLSYVHSTGTWNFAIAPTGTAGAAPTFTTSTSVSATGLSSFAYVPTGSTVPTNGMYLAAANTLTFSTNSAERLRIGSGGQIGIGGPNWGTAGQALISAGSGAAPAWGNMTVSSLVATTNILSTLSTASSTMGVYVGSRGASSPMVYYSDPSSAADQKLWRVGLLGGSSTFVINTLNDSDSASGNFLTAVRSGTAITSTTITSAALTATGTFQSTTLTTTSPGATAPGLSIGGAGAYAMFTGTSTNPPSFTTRSAGTKLVLYNALTASAVDFALGIEGSTLWTSVPDTTQQFRWYAGTTVVGTLTGTGNYTVTGNSIGAAHIPTGSTAPTNGLYLPATNSVGFSTNSTEAVRIDSNGNLLIQRVGAGLRIKEGSNAKMGVSTLVAGTVVVSTTAVTANSRIFLTTQSVGGTAGFLVVSARTAGTSFTILSSSGTDTSVVAWMIVEPA